MLNKLKEYLKYRKNKKIAKRELIAIMATTLPVAREVSVKGSDIIKFIVKLTSETKNADGEVLVKMVLDKIAELLKTDNHRIIEILSYIATLSSDDIQKIIIHSMVETMPK